MAKSRTCSHCESQVRTASSNGVLVAAVHSGSDGMLCPGTGLMLVGPSHPAPPKKKSPKRASNNATGRKRVKKKAHDGRRKLSPQERATIRESEALERADWLSAQRSEMGGRRSVRTVSGGAPTLGKRR